MAKILMRAGLSPLENLCADQVIFHNLIGENAGNMLFPYSIMRVLMRGDTQITTIAADRFYPAGQIAEWNESYDYFVIPLANAFRRSFRMQLGFLTDLVKKLKMPCIVIGAGVQAGVNGLRGGAQEFDREVLEFMKAVLKKSALAGVRGEFTAQYLKKLGFVEEKDFTVIGCPSMYLYGPRLPLKERKELTPQSYVSVNLKIKVPLKLSSFVLGSAKRFENYMYIPQGIDDLLLLYAGVSIDREKFPKIRRGYPWQLHSKICASGHEAGFTDARSWLAFLAERDFSFGTRIHGNIAAVLAGTPAFIFAPDGRILELARYHQIQHMLAEDITDETDIFKVYEQADFEAVKRGHAGRFAHYADFLEKNGLKHIYMEENGTGRSMQGMEENSAGRSMQGMEGNGAGRNVAVENDGCAAAAENFSAVCKFDQLMQQLPLHGPVLPLNKLPLKEQTARLQSYYAFLKDSGSEAEKSMKKLKDFAKKLPAPVRSMLMRSAAK